MGQVHSLKFKIFYFPVSESAGRTKLTGWSMQKKCRLAAAIYKNRLGDRKNGGLKLHNEESIFACSMEQAKGEVEQAPKRSAHQRGVDKANSRIVHDKIPP
jgi:hypothetical protein